MKKAFSVFMVMILLFGIFQVLAIPTAQAAFGDTLTTTQVDAAIAWAKNQLGATRVERPGRFSLVAGRHCGSFVWSAFYYGCGVDLYPSYNNATEMREDMRNRGFLSTTGTPPKGAIVFFSISEDGHVGISLGNGEYIHLGSTNVNIAKLSEASNYEGWSRPFEYLLPTGSFTTPKPTPQVTPPPTAQPTGISLSNTTLTIKNYVCYNLTATVTPSNTANKNVTWKSSSPSVATVDSTGMVDPKNNGTTTITATTANNISASCVVTVNLGGIISAPTDLRVEYSSHRESTNPPSYTATVSWDAVSGAAYYEVEYKTSTNTTWRVETDYTNNTATSYISGSNSGMVYGRTYYFRVRTVNASGDKSGWIETRSTIQTPSSPTPTPTSTPEPPPPPPIGLKVEYSYHRESTNPPSYTAIVSWDAVSGATYYEVEYKTSTNTTWRAETDYTNNTVTSYISGSNSGMVYGRTYYFRVCAVNASGDKSGWTEISYIRQ